MKTKSLFVWLLIIVFGSIPIALLILLGPGDYSSPSHTLGQIAGLVGLNLFALTFVFSTRARWIEWFFDGLDKLYPVHAFLGASSLVLLLLHPILLVLKFIPEHWNLAAKYLVPGGLISVDLGIISLAGLIALIMITLYAKIGYQKWKLSHEFMGLIFIIGIIHVFMVREDVARDLIFDGYYVYASVTAVIGIGAFIYSLIRPYLFGKIYIVDEIKRVGTCFDIMLRPTGNGISYRAGQFAFFKFYSTGLSSESHPFSIASASGNGALRIIPKALGDYTAKFGNVKKGDRVLVEGPYGMFHSKTFEREIWVAGGIGITPFIGLARDLTSSADVNLFYSVKTQDELVGIEDLRSIEKAVPGFKVHTWIADQQGYISLEQIEKVVSGRGAQWYLCGPEGLKQTLMHALKSKGVPQERMHSERFAFK
ncbi:ferric reductase-like transmembrane domain-containing protein [Candidatus Woesearchaeota archaeon]|nr:ferric reductase-like transmembrane domain-containing protein [Candidatus Woesearchaeota archaeon]